jgi:hypothetical protein
VQPNEAVLITAADRLHRVGYVLSTPGEDGVLFQSTAFDGSPLEYPSEARHSVRERDVVRLHDIPSGGVAGDVVLCQAGGGGVTAAELIAAEVNGTWTATVGLYRDGRVAPGVRQSVDLTDWRTPQEIAAAIESQRKS